MLSVTAERTGHERMVMRVRSQRERLSEVFGIEKTTGGDLEIVGNNATDGLPRSAQLRVEDRPSTATTKPAPGA